MEKGLFNDDFKFLALHFWILLTISTLQYTHFIMRFDYADQFRKFIQ